jgi:flagellar biosynthesis chaperone FliJ
MKLYIDTNIYLTFYHFTNDDLNELEKLVVLLENNEIELFLPEQTRNEFKRNRDVRIADSIERFKEQRLSTQFPQISKVYEEFTLLKESLKNFEKYKNNIITKILEDAKTYQLKADKIISQIFEKATKIPLTDEILAKAKTRFDLGNPPGKGSSYGDAINWESLLKVVYDEDDLFLISDDSDFTSKIDKNALNPFLKDEWIRRKNSRIFFIKKISEFFNLKYPDIKISSELNKDILIRNLSSTGTFSSAKSRLHKLSAYQDFSNQQLNDIIEAAVSNNQIYWIREDEGVGDFLIKIFKDNESRINENLRSLFIGIYIKESDTAPEEDWLPF